MGFSYEKKTQTRLGSQGKELHTTPITAVGSKAEIIHF